MKHSLKLLAAAVVLALPTASFAGPITFTVPADATNYTYAKELVTTTTNILPGSAAGALTATSPKLGFGVSINQTRYVRFDLSGGTYGSTAQTAGLSITDTAGTALTSQPGITVIDGGASGDNYVIYQITASGSGLTASNGFTFQISSLLMTDTTVPVTVKYAMFETAAAAAQNAATGKLAESAAPVVVAQTGNGLNMTVTETALANTPTANVTANPAYSIFKSLSAPNASTTVAEPSSVVVKLAALDPATSALPADMSGFLGTAPKMTLSGASDLTAFKATGAAVSLAVGTDCTSTTSIPGTINADNTVTFSPTGANLLGSSTTATGLHLCMKVGSTPAKAIAAQSFMLALDTAKNGLVLGPQAAGQIKRNGLVLRAPFFSDAGTSAASINLANMTPTDIKFNVRCLYKGKVEKAGFQDQVLTGAQTKRLYTGTAAAGIGCPSYAGTPATSVSAIELTFETDGIGAVNGTVIRENATTGEVGMSEMTGNTISNPAP